MMLWERCGLVRDLVPWQREEALPGGPCWQGEVWSVQGIPLLSLQTGLTAACDTRAQADFKKCPDFRIAGRKCITVKLAVLLQLIPTLGFPPSPSLVLPQRT